jgi:hypothetical protein
VDERIFVLFALASFLETRERLFFACMAYGLAKSKEVAFGVVAGGCGLRAVAGGLEGLHVEGKYVGSR